jgi:hypothetical protein
VAGERFGLDSRRLAADEISWRRRTGVLSIQWGRGLFRLWVVLSLIWLIGVGAFAYTDWRSHLMPIESQFCKDLETPDRVPNCEKSQAESRAEVSTRREVTIAAGIAPPFVCWFLAWHCGGWRWASDRDRPRALRATGKPPSPAAWHCDLDAANRAWPACELSLSLPAHQLAGNMRPPRPRGQYGPS